MSRNRALILLALFPFALAALIAVVRRPFTRWCAGDLVETGYGTEAMPLLPIVAVMATGAGPGPPGKLVRHTLGRFEVGVFSYGHDPPRWYADLLMDDACNTGQRVGLGLINDGTIELRQRGSVYQIVGVERDGTRAFYHAVKEPAPSRMYEARPAGLALLVAVIFALIGLALARKVRLLGLVLGWPEGVVRDDGCLEPSEAGAPIRLACGCAKKPGKRILYMPRKMGEAGPYREHGRGRLADHAIFSRAEGTRDASRLRVMAIAASTLGSALAVAAFFLAGT